MDTSSKIGKQAGAKSAKREHPQTEGRRDRNKREKVARITAAARTLFHAKGYTKTTTQEVAEAADIGAGTLFLYAKSKEDLLILVFKDEMSQLIEEVYGTIRKKAPLLEQAESLFDGFIEYHRRDVVIARALIRELSFSGNPGRRKDVLTIPEAIIEKLVHFVSAARARGEIRADIDAMISLFDMGNEIVGYLGLMLAMSNEMRSDKPITAGNEVGKAEVLERRFAEYATIADVSCPAAMLHGLDTCKFLLKRTDLLRQGVD